MKTKVILISMGAALILSSAIVAQQATVGKKDTAKTVVKYRRNYVDKNNDSICDNFQARAKTFKGKNFVDKNNDGICDNRQGAASGNCCGKGYGRGKGNGNGFRHRYGNGGNCCRRK